MAQFKNKTDRTDTAGRGLLRTTTTSIKPIGGGFYGVRVMCDGVITQEGTARNRRDAAVMLKDLLRWENKLGSSSPMASASRDRRKGS